MSSSWLFVLVLFGLCVLALDRLLGIYPFGVWEVGIMTVHYINGVLFSIRS